jgi:hypothetical protein
MGDAREGGFEECRGLRRTNLERPDNSPEREISAGSEEEMVGD